MKITEVRARVVVPIPDQLETQGYRAAFVLVQVHTDEGITGIGECTNWPHHSDLIVAHAVDMVATSLVGRDPAAIEAIWVDTFAQYTYLGPRGLITSVISGIDQALWDIKGKVLGRPVHDLLGGAVREGIPLYTHPGGSTPDESVAATMALVEQGFTAFKFDPFHETGPNHTAYRDGHISRGGVRAGVEIIKAVREAVPVDTELLIDLHGNYNVESAVRCIEALQPYEITWFEEPLPPQAGPEPLRQIRARTGAPISLGERLYTRWDFLPYLRDGLVEFVMPDPCWTGGITELKKIANLAEVHSVPIAPHGALGPLQAFASAHTVATVPNLYRLEIHGPAVIEHYHRALTEPMDIRDGRLYLPDRPGLGVDLDEEYLRAYAHPDRP